MLALSCKYVLETYGLIGHRLIPENDCLMKKMMKWKMKTYGKPWVSSGRLLNQDMGSLTVYRYMYSVFQD